MSDEVGKCIGIKMKLNYNHRKYNLRKCTNKQGRQI